MVAGTTDATTTPESLTSTSTASCKTSIPSSPTLQAIREMELPQEDAGSGSALYRINHDDDDIASVTSTTSTLEFGHEPFETFKDKVADLCASYFPGCGSKDFEIEHINGGTFNRVAGVALQHAQAPAFTLRWLRQQFQRICGLPRAKRNFEYVVRVPRDELKPYQMDYDVAVLKFARSRLSTPVPQIVFADVTENNALGKPFTIQKRLPGVPLHTISWPIHVPQYVSLTREIVKFLKEMQTITSLSAGNVKPQLGIHDSTTPVVTTKFTVKAFPLPDGTIPDPKLTDAKPQTTLEWTLHRAFIYKLRAEAAGYDHEITIWSHFEIIVQKMHELGLIPDTDPFFLCHLDFKARNILVETPSDLTMKITGVLDWDRDYACFAPKFVAYGSPFWLWIPESADENDEANANVEPADAGDIAAKKVFNQMAGDEWRRYAYSPEYIIARRMFPILVQGLFYDWMIEEAWDIVKDWNKLHPDPRLEDKEYDCDYGQSNGEDEE